MKIKLIETDLNSLTISIETIKGVFHEMGLYKSGAVASYHQHTNPSKFPKIFNPTSGHFSQGNLFALKPEILAHFQDSKKTYAV